MLAFYLTTDLFFSTRVCGVAQQLGLDLQTIASVDAILKQAAEPSLVLIDLQMKQLDLPTAIENLKKRWPTVRIVAYAPHVQTELLAAAQAASCDEVYSRGQFDRDMRRVLQG